jgi:hypothetical protein
MNIAPTTPRRRMLCAGLAAVLFIAGLLLLGQWTWHGSVGVVVAGAALAGVGVTWLGAEAHSLLRQAMKSKSRKL